MCYDIKTQLQAQLRRAKRYGDQTAVEEIGQKLLPFTDLPLYHSSGFQFPRMLIYSQKDPLNPSIASWGLLPHWVRTVEQKKKIRVQTLNARWETLFEKPAFRLAARNGRCVIGIEGFYEHFHFRGKTYPCFIRRRDKEPMQLAGLSETTEDPESGEAVTTFSIVTVSANTLMSAIHNNPKAKESRMPLILNSEEEENIWLKPEEEHLLEAALQTVAHSMEDGLLDFHTVGRLRGKEYRGNVQDISEPMHYPELQGSGLPV